MTLNTRGKTTAIERVADQSGSVAHPATDERLELVRQQDANGQGSQITYTLQSSTPEQMPDNDVPDGHGVLIQGHHENTGVVYVGDADTQAHALGPRESLTWNVADTSEIFAQSDTSGNMVVLTWVVLG